jgi:mRNA interferase RelE/StbE
MFEIRLEQNAEKFLKKLDESYRKRIISKLKDLSQNPELGKPLTANLAGLWSLRIGDYRAIYQIQKDKLVIFVLKLGHRKNIY